MAFMADCLSAAPACGPDHQGIFMTAMDYLKGVQDAVLRLWPEHERAIGRNLESCSDRARRHAAETAELITHIAGGDLDRLALGYRWMCEMILEEELFFRRENRYRRTSFAEAERDVYARPEIMDLYMDGLLLSQAIWSNHIKSLDFFIEDFLPRRRPGGRHLEIGPGHGLLLCFAARGGVMVEGWDVSDRSLAHTRACAERLGIAEQLHLVRRNIFESPDDAFDSLVLSEVLEHLETPDEALAIVRNLLRPGGIVFINVPVNAPTIDHISLFRTPEEIVQRVQQTGLAIVETLAAPAAGYSEERARKLHASMSCCVIAKRL
jgi:2-polyprenyl-3-methyl-5-hydroxy-6-metoxy-1,4-benzoquinol methylase